MKLRNFITNISVCADAKVFTKNNADIYEEVFFAKCNTELSADDFPGKLLKLNVEEIQVDCYKNAPFISIFCGN